ncbi:MAG: hypothetical protein AAB512_01265 [Patescibacteria group bacterium]
MLLAQMMRYGSDGYFQNNATNSGNYWANHPMMWAWGNGFGFWLGSIFCLISWIVILAVLIALARWLWKKGDNEKKGK